MNKLSWEYLNKTFLKYLPSKIWILIVIPNDILTSCTYAREKQYFLAAPYIHIHAHTHYMKWPRSASSWNNRIYECCDPESRKVTRCRERFPAASFLMRYTYTKKYTRSWRRFLPSAHIYPFPISPMSRVVFVSRRKADARTRKLTDFRGRDCAPGLHRTCMYQPSLALRVRSSYPVWGAISVRLSLLSFSSRSPRRL